MSARYPFTLIKQEIAKRQGKALDFAVGTQPFPLPPELFDWIRSNSDLALVAGTPDDIGAFSETAAGYLRRQFDLEIDPEHILPTAGGRAAMGILAACALNHGETVLVTEPGYPAFARLAAQRGADVIVSALDPENEFAPESVPRADSARSFTMLAVNYPNNPTGGTLSAAVIERLGELSDSGCIVFNDATYAPLVYAAPTRSMLAPGLLPDGDVDVVELHSISKLHPIGPLAVSFLAGSAPLLQALGTYSEYAWSPLSRLQLSLSARCLADDDRVQKIRTLVPQRLALLESTLQGLGFKTHTAHSGMYMICDVPEEIAGDRPDSAQQAARLLMDRFDIAVVPLDTRSRSYLRFTALYRLQDLERLAELESRLKIS